MAYCNSSKTFVIFFEILLQAQIALEEGEVPVGYVIGHSAQRPNSRYQLKSRISTQPSCFCPFYHAGVLL
jgi:hypothetical protein